MDADRGVFLFIAELCGVFMEFMFIGRDRMMLELFNDLSPVNDNLMKRNIDQIKFISHSLNCIDSYYYLKEVLLQYLVSYSFSYYEIAIKAL